MSPGTTEDVGMQLEEIRYRYQLKKSVIHGDRPTININRLTAAVESMRYATLPHGTGEVI